MPRIFARLRELGATATLALAALSMALAGCVPNLGPAPQSKPLGVYAASRSLQGPSAAWPTDDWWKAYGDPQLDSLIAEALAGSPDLAAAEARVRQAQAQVEETGATRQVQANASGSIKETGVDQKFGIPAQFSAFLPKGFRPATQIAGNIQYTLDFFGRNRAALAAATSTADAARADAAAARLQLSTGVAAAYAQLAQLYADREEALEAVRVREATLNLIGDRLRNGLETRGAYSQQAATVPVSKSDVEAIDRQIVQTGDQIAALLGKGPDRGLAITRPANIAARSFGLPQSLMADLIGRRPDLTAARLRAEAAAHQIKVARTDFYPNVNLVASVTDLALHPEDLFRRNLALTQIGPAITLPIFSGGRLEGAYRGARAEYDQAVASYDQTLTNALRDVADAVAAERTLQTQLGEARQALASNEDADRIAQLRYRAGLSPYLNVLTAESAVLEQRRALTDLQAQALTLDVQLVRALGGGYVAPTVKTASASPAR